MSTKNSNRYLKILETLFQKKHSPGVTEFAFNREDIDRTCDHLKIDRPKNFGDVLYSYRYRRNKPKAIRDLEPDGLQWEIIGCGRGSYKFKLSRILDLSPRQDLLAIKLPDATPEIVLANALGDEQALLAKVRYNRLIDIFLGITAYSLQNHLRTQVKGMGQVEIDELYIGIDKKGRQYIVPVQAKVGEDHLGSVQTKQDIACCKQKYPLLICRTVSVQFLDTDRVAMFEIVEDQNKQLKIVEERHYQLVNASEISASDLAIYAGP